MGQRPIGRKNENMKKWMEWINVKRVREIRMKENLTEISFWKAEDMKKVVLITQAEVCRAENESLS